MEEIDMQKLNLLPFNVFLFLSVMIFIILFCSGPQFLYDNAYADDSSNNPQEWKTFPTIGKYLNSEPQKPSQIFNVQYRVINGTLNSIVKQEGTFHIEVKSINENGLLDFKIPLNYPYTNDDTIKNGENFIVLIGRTDVFHKFGPSRLDDCFFGFSIPFSDNVTIELAPFFFPEPYPFRGDEVPNHCIKDTILSISPKKQLEAGITLIDIICKEKLELVIKKNTGSPACVNPESKNKLIERGWAKVD